MWNYSYMFRVEVFSMLAPWGKNAMPLTKGNSSFLNCQTRPYSSHALRGELQPYHYDDVKNLRELMVHSSSPWSSFLAC